MGKELWLCATLLLFTYGCVSMFTATTEATYTPGGALTYKSSKNQENFKAKVELDESGKLRGFDVTTTATTPEAAIAAAAKALSEITAQIAELVKLATKAAPAP